MSVESPRVPGSLVWFDLTVPNATTMRDFYSAVVGWQNEPLDMGEYSDFMMKTSGNSNDTPVSGICHARGVNADLPPVWLIYISVTDLDASIERCLELGGAVVAGPKGDISSGRYCVIRDPAGAISALIEEPRAT